MRFTKIMQWVNGYILGIGTSTFGFGNTNPSATAFGQKQNTGFGTTTGNTGFGLGSTGFGGQNTTGFNLGSTNNTSIFGWLLALFILS